MWIFPPYLSPSPKTPINSQYSVISSKLSAGNTLNFLSLNAYGLFTFDHLKITFLYVHIYLRNITLKYKNHVTNQPGHLDPFLLFLHNPVVSLLPPHIYSQRQYVPIFHPSKKYFLSCEITKLVTGKEWNWVYWHPEALNGRISNLEGSIRTVPRWTTRVILGLFRSRSLRIKILFVPIRSLIR